MTIPETAINWLDADIPIQLTGIVNKDLMQASAQLPVKVTGMLTDPTIEFQPGSLLRFKGQLTETLTVKDARLPLAGSTLSSKGFNGHLNAIVLAEDTIWGIIGPFCWTFDRFLTLIRAIGNGVIGERAIYCH